ncbi:hypothetical protein [Luteolibacter soli]|uniref:Tetratricopeptide repeat protein n=1 Tax=Luteolibacter soli TaxID=3135280 RepID=A0ABU9B3I8_9BACT
MPHRILVTLPLLLGFAAWFFWQAGSNEESTRKSRPPGLLSSRSGEHLDSSTSLSGPGDAESRIAASIRNGDRALAAMESVEAGRYYFAAFLAARRLHSSHPDDPKIQNLLAYAFGKLGDALKQSEGEEDQVVEWHRIALGHLEQLSRSEPGNLQWQLPLSTSYASMGKMALKKGDLDDARYRLEANHSIREKLALDSPGDPLQQVSLADSHLALADISLRAGKQQDASSHFNIARGQIEQAVATGSTSISSDYALVLKTVLSNFEGRLNASQEATTTEGMH